MEEWQKKYINDNLPKLIQMTRVNTLVQASLQSEGILSDDDISILEATKGRFKQSAYLYGLLPDRKSAYEKLTKALFEAKQSGAANILLEGLTKHGIRTSLTHCGIPIEHGGFENTNILAYGKAFKLKMYFPNADLGDLRKIFYDTLPEHVYYESFIKKKEFELFKDTIPPEPAYYVPRFLSNRIKIDTNLFQCNCPDVFVFKGMERDELTMMVKPNETSSSLLQIERLDSRFIYLELDEDWEEILQKATVPVHLIKYESYERVFILENTSGISDILSKHCSDQDRAYVEEDEFVKQQLTKKTMSNGVCICDTPGMGKTVLLANIARKFVQQCPTSITAFITLSDFVQNKSSHPPNIDGQPAEALLCVFKYITSTTENAKIITALAEKNFVRIYLFFDGFDEITSLEVEWMEKIFHLLTTSDHPINIYVTSRLHMRRELQSSLKVVAYDILPFKLENQVDFLINSWTQEYPNCNLSSLKTYALHVLRVVKETLSDDENGIAGIPLLCGLIASIYAKEAKLHSTSDATAKEIRCPSRSICEMYKAFIDMKIDTTISNISSSKEGGGQSKIIDAKGLKLFHIRQAWKLLFPESNIFENVEDFQNSNFEDFVFYKVGIMQERSSGNIVKMEFVHRTFAEYLIAEYLAGYLFSCNISNPKYDALFGFILKDIFNILGGECLEFEVIIYFLNSSLTSQMPFRSTENLTKLFCESLPATCLHDLLIHCCSNLYFNIFSLLKNILLSCQQNVRDIYGKYFTKEICFDIIASALHNFSFVKECFQLSSRVFNHDIMDICQMYVGKNRKRTLLQIAVSGAQYEAVEFFLIKPTAKTRTC